MGETKRVATQNIKSECSVNSVWKSVFETLVQSGFWCKKTDYILFERFVKASKKSIGILMQQIEPEVSEKIDFGDRDKSKFKAPFGFFGPSGFCCNEENRHLFNLNVCSKLKFFDWDRDGRNHASTNGEKWFWKSMWIKTKNLQCVPVIIILMQESN